MQIFLWSLMKSVNPNYCVFVMIASRVDCYYSWSGWLYLFLLGFHRFFYFRSMISIITNQFANHKPKNYEITQCKISLIQQIMDIIKKVISFVILQINKAHTTQQTMHSKSNYVKSKKEKLNDIRQQKKIEKSLQAGRDIKPRIQVIVDSDSANSNSIEILDKDKKQSAHPIKNQHVQFPANQNIETKFNNFNFDRLRKVQNPYKKENKPVLLGVAQCYQSIDESNPHDNRAISYKKVGISVKKTVSQNYLKTRLQKIEEEETISPVNKNIVEVGNSMEKIENKGTDQKAIKKIPRYFDDELQSDDEQNDEDNQSDEQNKKKTIKCYRCGQKGHIARLCNQRQILKCIYCLGPHHSSQCTDKLCHRCNQKGHIKQQCQSDKIQCKRCRNIGHVAKNCGKIIMMNFSSDREKEIVERYAREDLQKLKCMKCNGVKESKGHFNCHEYAKRMPKVYEETYIVL